MGGGGGGGGGVTRSLRPGDGFKAAATPVSDVTLPTESDWDTYQMESRILRLLGDTPSHPTGDVGRLFLTPYQIAIQFAEHFPQDTARMGRPIGGTVQGIAPWRGISPRSFLTGSPRLNSPTSKCSSSAQI